VASSASPSGAPEVLLEKMIEAAQSRPSLLQALRGATARIEGDTLALEVVPDFGAFAAMHLDEYRELLARTASKSLKLRIGAGAAPLPEPTAASPTEVRRERLLKEAQKEPAVQEALDLFDGRLVDVREAKTGQ
jgi:hypothetical protein